MGDEHALLREAKKLAEIVAERMGPDYGDGIWRSCSGCYETFEGRDFGEYPHSLIFDCKLGGGCPVCSASCREEHFEGPGIEGRVTLWICSNHKRFGGKCPDENAYLSAEAWNERSVARTPSSATPDIDVREFPVCCGTRNEHHSGCECGEVMGYWLEPEAATALETLEARVNVLEEALSFYGEQWVDASPDQRARGWDTVPSTELVSDAGYKARAALLKQLSGDGE